MASTDGGDRSGDAASVARAAWASVATGQVAASLAAAGIPVMVLKGPPLQHRLLGRESAYESADVDLLVPRHHGRRARSRLRAEGWRFVPDNGLLWRLDRAVAVERSRVVVDLHWGIHLGPLPPWTTRPLERALWAAARPTEGGWWEPRPEPLLVYLALHAAAFGFAKPAGLVLVEAAAALVEDWDEVDSLGGRLGARVAVQDALARARQPTAGGSRGEAAAPPVQPPLLAGWRGRVLSGAARALRTAVVPAPARRALRAGRDRVLGGRRR